MQGKRRHIAR